MKKFFSIPVVAAMAGLSTSALVAAGDSTKAEQLAQAVWKASGGPDWSKVKTIDFTFVVEKNGKTVAQAQHHWDVAAQTDEVKWKGKDVTVNLAEPGANEDAKAAFARWTNDSYWLLMPLKLKDHGVTVKSEGTKEIDGAERETLRLSFGQVGLTPNDNYRLYIDPATNRVTSWDYMPKGEKGMTGTWENYKEMGGLTLATEHKMENNVRIRLQDLKVTLK